MRCCGHDRCPSPDGDLVGLSVTGGVAHFPGVATERTVALGTLEPERVSALLEAADAVALFTRPTPDKGPVRPDGRIWVLRIIYDRRSRLLALPEPFPDPGLATLMSLARGCLSATRMVGDETPRIGAGVGTVGRKAAAESSSILDALDTPCARDIEVSFDQSVSYPRPATLD
jgi:hypothetical protein